MMIVDCLAVAEREKQSKAFREQLVAQTDHLDHFVCFFILKNPLFNYCSMTTQYDFSLLATSQIDWIIET
jgi:hypothetical protein